ncbi:TOTE conflict system archaeo-eukaryotic primase domain-containing protein [Desemzia sp. FAM 23991]|uniref:TOTE conflict system archaeo-eukaryotic primase domain-containing protein n=1 Tax=unclassified Desemzia TaxID=2685243 RepID=UPI003883DD65
MNYEELLKAYNQLKQENDELKEEVSALKNMLNHEAVLSESDATTGEVWHKKTESKIFDTTTFNKYAPTDKKIELYMTLFRGRDDVYAKRFIHSKTGRPAYAPVKVGYWDSSNKSYAPLDSQVVNSHLRGNIIAGIFPIGVDDSCYFLAIDLDKKEWQKDAAVLRKVAKKYQIPVNIERSRSGNGAHIWFFFEEAVPARRARKFGSLLITDAMNAHAQIDFSSYDRLFPNQDTLPKGGFGNLIALPLQKEARQNGNSVFVDEDFLEYEDQWQFLSQIKKISLEELAHFIEILTKETDSVSSLGLLSNRKSEGAKNNVSLTKEDFSETVNMIKLNQLYIHKSGVSQKGLNLLKRMAAFQNPEFYQAQAMRKSTWKIPRIISCSNETEDYLILPRGLQEQVEELFKEAAVSFEIEDRSFEGKETRVSFKGKLRAEQEEAVEKMLAYHTGILCGTTAFGKTISALNMIARKKVNTLILVNKTSLVEQWQEKINEFLVFENDEESNVGQLGGGKKKLSNKIDVALLQSMYRKGKVHESIYNYGMIIVDECHHISAFSFESVLQQANAKYVYGLTATPTRKDGHQPIVFMQCGPIRFQDNNKKQMEKRPFEHTVVTRFVPFDPLLQQNMELQELYNEVAESQVRNEKIIKDIVNCYKEGRNSIILTERVAHVETLEKLLKKEIPDIIAITGGMSKKERREKLKQIREVEKNEPLTIISTGRYIGEGFDEPRLDTLFLAMPISWKGRVQQYAGRLHRLYKGKTEVRIYDYADIHVPVLEKMYQKRLRSYSSLGYTVKMNEKDAGERSIIYSSDQYVEQLKEDMTKSQTKVVISSPSLTKQAVTQFLKEMISGVDQTVALSVITRNYDSIKSKSRINNQKSCSQQLEQKAISVSLESNLYHHCVIIDSNIVWYGSINVLGQNNKENLFIRLESPKVAEGMEEVLNKK